jgi:phosphoribosyl 1,2-cyclic phosphodiesterase
MSLQITSLNSGSNGNCYYIGNKAEAVLVDAGLSCRETEKRMKKLDLSMSTVKAIFISHEHADHISGLPGLAKKHQLPVYITKPTLEKTGFTIEPLLLHSFKKNIPVTIGKLSVTAFQKSHDAVDPHSFIISDGGVHIGVLTDIGYACKDVIQQFSICHAVFLESNYCTDMLDKGSYPAFLKDRINGDHGHLSNTQALDLFKKHRAKHLSHLILGHLSKNNNKPELVSELFNQHAGDTKIIVASRYNETAVYMIGEERNTIERKVIAKKQQHKLQLSLFG